MKFTAIRKPETVEAIEYTEGPAGSNREYIERELERHLGRAISLAALLEPGSFVLLQPNARWQTLPRAAFLRLYEPAKAKTCFDCKFFVLVDGSGRCGVFDEPIDSEIVAGSDCDAFEAE